MYIKKHSLKIYPGKLIIVISKDFKSVAKKYNIRSINCASIAFCNKNSGKFYLWLNPDNMKSDIVIHELVHLVNYIFEYICHEPTTYNDEPQAYLQEFLFNKINKTKKQFKKQNHKK